VFLRLLLHLPPAPDFRGVTHLRSMLTAWERGVVRGAPASRPDHEPNFGIRIADFKAVTGCSEVDCRQNTISIRNAKSAIRNPKPEIQWGYDLKAMMPALQAGRRGSNPLSSTKKKEAGTVGRSTRVSLTAPAPAPAASS
jgi:hypothetical protein